MVHDLRGVCLPWLRQLVPSLSLWKPRFTPMPANMGFVVDKVAVGQVFPCEHDFVSALYSYFFSAFAGSGIWNVYPWWERLLMVNPHVILILVIPPMITSHIYNILRCFGDRILSVHSQTEKTQVGPKEYLGSTGWIYGWKGRLSHLDA
jgi:hypothetical protein